jgi:hypothetical protein
MGEIDIISEQIQRMRQRHVEPSAVTVCDEVYLSLGKPKKLSGVPVDCDRTMKGGWWVR